MWSQQVYAPLQGKTASTLLPTTMENEFNTIRYYSDQQVWEKSDAILKIMSNIGGIWKLSSVFWIIPKGIRDKGYDLIAIRRKTDSWIGRRFGFGEEMVCELGMEQPKRRFLLE